jgi:hypothetical protein
MDIVGALATATCRARLWRKAALIGRSFVLDLDRIDGVERVRYWLASGRRDQVTGDGRRRAPCVVPPDRLGPGGRQRRDDWSGRLWKHDGSRGWRGRCRRGRWSRRSWRPGRHSRSRWMGTDARARLTPVSDAGAPDGGAQGPSCRRMPERHRVRHRGGGSAGPRGGEPLRADSDRVPRTPSCAHGELRVHERTRRPTGNL